MASDGSIFEKTMEKAGGALEKLVDFQMLILGLSLLMYADIWLIRGNINPSLITFENGLDTLKHASVQSIIAFVASYSLLMAAGFPALRFIYGKCWMAIWPKSYVYEDRSLEAKRLSNWSVGFISFALWDGLMGYFAQVGKYHGAVVTVCNELTENDPVTAIFRIVIVIFVIFCFAGALQRDS
jgi:hypothetical protein